MPMFLFYLNGTANKMFLVADVVKVLMHEHSVKKESQLTLGAVYTAT